METEIEDTLREKFGIAISRATFPNSDVPEALLDIRGKAVLKEGQEAILGQIDADVFDVARNIEPAAVCEDIKTFLGKLVELS